jgi:hypothetical protein
MLDPDHDPDAKPLIALKFAIKLEEGERLSTALTSACEEVLGQERAEKTLKSWLVKVFDLKKWPARATAAEWKLIAQEHYVAERALLEKRFRRIRKQSRETPF